MVEVSQSYMAKNVVNGAERRTLVAKEQTSMSFAAIAFCLGASLPSFCTYEGHVSVSLCVCLSAYLYAYLPFHDIRVSGGICLPVCLYVYLYDCLSITVLDYVYTYLDARVLHEHACTSKRVCVHMRKPE